MNFAKHLVNISVSRVRGTVRTTTLRAPRASPAARFCTLLLGGCRLALGLDGVLAPQAHAQIPGVGVGIPPAAPVDGVAAPINKGVASFARFREDIWNDPVLKPAQVTQFIGLKPGDRVADFVPGHMYWSRLFAKVVGLDGRVYPFVPQLGCRPAHPGCVAGLPSSTSIGYSLKERPQQTLLGDPRANGIDEAIDVADIWDFSRNTAVIWNVAEQFSVPEQLDVVWSFGHWHNLRTWDYALNMQVFLPLLFESIKPGGVFVVADYASAPGQGFTQVEPLHRVDKEAVKAELVQAGFEFVGESDLLANSADDHTSRVDDNALLVSGKVDMFLMKFRKPQSAPKDRRVPKAQYGDIMDSNLRSSTAPVESGGGVWTNADGTYQEYNAGVGRWFFDAHGNLCLWNEYPRAVRGLLGCHKFHTVKFDEPYGEDVNEGRTSHVILRKQRSYVSHETAIQGQGGRSGQPLVEKQH
jgi:predicted methyltransferase